MIKLAVSGGSDRVSAFWNGLMYAGPLSPALFLRMKPLFLAGVPAAEDGEAPSLAGKLHSGWISKIDQQQTRIVTDEELRDCLLRGGIEFRYQVLWQLARWTKEDGASRRADALAFLRAVCPRQRLANGPRETEGLLQVLVALDEDFPAGVEAVIRCLAPLDRHASLYLHDFDKPDEPEGALLQRFPGVVLGLLRAVLPIDVSKWPHNTRAVLDRIAEQGPALATDSRLLELRRKLERPP